MKKSKWSKDGMKQIISSGWKEFDRQTNCIATGNVTANTQFSLFVRPWKETECNGFTRPEGHLLNYDLNQFGNHRIPQDIEEILRDEGREESVILYMFFTISKEKRVEPFAWVVTDRQHKLIMYRVVRYGNQSWQKRYDAAREAISYITE